MKSQSCLTRSPALCGLEKSGSSRRFRSQPALDRLHRTRACTPSPASRADNDAVNSLVDQATIEKLYQLLCRRGTIVRGILVPVAEGWVERYFCVISVVGRFLEHSRI